MAFVLDSSVALTWLMPDEANEHADALARRLETENALVPPIWPLEVGNAMLTAVRRKRITNAEFQRYVAALGDIPIDIDGGAQLSDILRLAQQCQLTSYDAAYLELAQRRNASLATFDVALRAACHSLEIPVLP